MHNLSILVQEVLNNNALRLFLGKSKCPELKELLIVDPSDRRLVNDRRVLVSRTDLRNGSVLGVCHYD